MQTEMSSSPAGGLRLPAGKHTGILTDFQTKVKKKIKNSLQISNHRLHRLYVFWSVGRWGSIENAVLAGNLTRIGKNSPKYVKSTWLEVTIDLMLMEVLSCIFLLI